MGRLAHGMHRRVAEFHVGDPRHRELLQELLSSGDCEEEEAKEAALSLGSLHMGYPALSIDDDLCTCRTGTFATEISKYISKATGTCAAPFRSLPTTAFM